jgi:hypothetical protein
MALAEEHKTVILSILATLLAAIVIFLATIAVNGGISVTLVEAYVLPLIVTAFSLSVFAGVLIARNRGMIPGFEPETKEQKKQQAEESQTPAGTA